MNHTSNRILLLAAIMIPFGSAFSTGSYAATRNGPVALGGFVAQSNLIFRGRVENIRYVMSQQGPDGQRVPFTFVTFRVDQTLKGSVSGRSLELSFMGGLDEAHGRFMSSDQSPLFDIGDDDILFVKAGANQLTPLVGHKRGIYRVIGEQVYTDDAEEVILEKGNAIRTGERHAFEETQSTRIGGRIMRFSGNTQAKVPLGPTAAINATDFLKAVEDEASRAGIGSASAFKGSDPNSTPSFPAAEASAPPAQ